MPKPASSFEGLHQYNVIIPDWADMPNDASFAFWGLMRWMISRVQAQHRYGVQVFLPLRVWMSDQEFEEALDEQQKKFLRREG